MTTSSSTCSGCSMMTVLSGIEWPRPQARSLRERDQMHHLVQRLSEYRHSGTSEPSPARSGCLADSGSIVHHQCRVCASFCLVSRRFVLSMYFHFSSTHVLASFIFFLVRAKNEPRRIHITNHPVGGGRTGQSSTLTLVVPQIGDSGCESRGQGGHGEWRPSRAGPRATSRAQPRPSFHIGTRYTYTVEARSSHFEPVGARGGRNSTGLTEGIARARRGLG